MVEFFVSIPFLSGRGALRVVFRDPGAIRPVRFNPLLVGARSAPDGGSKPDERCQHRFNPLLVGARSAPSCWRQRRCLPSTVSIPFLSGRGALRCTGAIIRLCSAGFQSPSCRGEERSPRYVSGTSRPLMPFQSPSCRGEERSSAFESGGKFFALEFQSPSCRGEERSVTLLLCLIAALLGFNPLLVGARSAPYQYRIRQAGTIKFQSPSCRGEERSAVKAVASFGPTLGFNPLLVGARSAPGPRHYRDAGLHPSFNPLLVGARSAPCGC